jgi:hypothetical protein
VSKASRRRQRPGTNPPSSRPASPPPTPTPAPADGPTVNLSAASAAGAPKTGASGASKTGPATAATAGAGASRPSSGAPRPSSSRTASSRAGRRERQRIVHQPSFIERYRTIIVVVAALAGVAVISLFVFFSASQAAYACSTIWTPDPTPSPSAGATPALGNIQPDMGHQHVNVGDKVTYTYCAPASGNHINKPGVAGPIPARVYGPGDNVIPQGWIHNLEHGGMVLLYQGNSTGATAEGQAQLKTFYDNFPPGPVCGTPKGVIGPVIARFDQMSTPFQAIVWGRVLQLDTFDQAKILAFWEQWGERTNPEKQCAAPSATPGASEAPAESAAPSATPTVTASPVPSDSAAPASAGPSAS